MGQKVNPNGFRMGATLNKGWSSVFYAKKLYANFLLQDINIRNVIFNSCKDAVISKVLILRPTSKCIVNIYAQKPGVIVGKGGKDIEKLKNTILDIVSLPNVFINLFEIKKIYLDAMLVAGLIVKQLEYRFSFRKIMKSAVQNCVKQGGSGIKVSCSGRLGGSDIARTEWYKSGKVPLHTLRADIDYACRVANTMYGTIGVKVWIYKGEKKLGL